MVAVGLQGLRPGVGGGVGGFGQRLGGDGWVLGFRQRRGWGPAGHGDVSWAGFGLGQGLAARAAGRVAAMTLARSAGPVWTSSPVWGAEMTWALPRYMTT